MSNKKTFKDFIDDAKSRITEIDAEFTVMTYSSNIAY